MRFANDHNANVGRRFSSAVAYPEPKDNRLTLRQGLKRPPVTRGRCKAAERGVEMSPAIIGSHPGNGLVVDPAWDYALVHKRWCDNTPKDSV